MIYMRQKNEKLLPAIQKYGCLFLCYASMTEKYFSEYILNEKWEEAIRKGFITGDLNKDGDFDDEGEAIMVNHQGVITDIFGLSYIYDNIHHKASEKIPENVEKIIGRFFWKTSHFVTIDKDKIPIYDPLENSLTVRYGKLADMRFLYRR